MHKQLEGKFGRAAALSRRFVALSMGLSSEKTLAGHG
jgi:hypothetical protein